MTLTSDDPHLPAVPVLSSQSSGVPQHPVHTLDFGPEMPCSWTAGRSVAARGGRWAWAGLTPCVHRSGGTLLRPPGPQGEMRLVPGTEMMVSGFALNWPKAQRRWDPSPRPSRASRVRPPCRPTARDSAQGSASAVLGECAPSMAGVRGTRRGAPTCQCPSVLRRPPAPQL